VIRPGHDSGEIRSSLPATESRTDKGPGLIVVGLIVLKSEMYMLISRLNHVLSIRKSIA
jgi:hypothetical protein